MWVTSQAIDRVHRLGQEREVYCTRYIMQSSFEEKIVALQKKKQKIADLSMTQGKSRKQQAQDKIDVSFISCLVPNLVYKRDG